MSVPAGDVFGIEVGCIGKAQRLGSGDAVFVVFELKLGDAGELIVERRPHDVDRYVQQHRNPCPTERRVAEQRDFIIVGADDAVDAVFLLVAQAFKKFIAVFFYIGNGFFV